MSPWEQYQRDIKEHGFVEDSAQREAVEHLQRVFDDLLKPVAKPEAKRSWLNKLGLKKDDVVTLTPVKGLYMWGGVGRGKTYLMDTFFNCLPIEQKLRIHFHRFMLRVHQELGELNDTANPLEKVADKLAGETRIICFDEFFVSDITDAMLLGTLFEALFARGVALVATSNIPPNLLYRNGLQRQRFLPTIALIEQHCEVLNVDGGNDYRMRTLNSAEIYHYPLEAAASDNLLDYFKRLASEPKQYDGVIKINNRPIVFRSEADSVLLSSFSALCEGARSQLDYIEIAKLYHTVLLDGVVQMGAVNDDAARRFIAMVDEFYERHVTLIIAAEVPVEQLYTEGQLNFEFERCISRLTEMQSKEYLALEHCP